MQVFYNLIDALSGRLDTLNECRAICAVSKASWQIFLTREVGICRRLIEQSWGFSVDTDLLLRLRKVVSCLQNNQLLESIVASNSSVSFARAVEKKVIWTKADGNIPAVILKTLFVGVAKHDSECCMRSFKAYHDRNRWQFSGDLYRSLDLDLGSVTATLKKQEAVKCLVVIEEERVLLQVRDVRDAIMSTLTDKEATKEVMAALINLLVTPDRICASEGRLPPAPYYEIVRDSLDVVLNAENLDHYYLKLLYHAAISSEMLSYLQRRFPRKFTIVQVSYIVREIVRNARMLPGGMRQMMISCIFTDVGDKDFSKAFRFFREGLVNSGLFLYVEW